MFVVPNETMIRHGVKLLKGAAYRVTDNDDCLLEIEGKDCWVDESEVRVYSTRGIKEIISKSHKMMFSVDETAHILYDDGLYQDGDPITPWFNGEKINVTVMGVLNDVAMVLPWCNGHEMILPVSQLMKGRV